MSVIDTSKHVVTLFLDQVKATPDAPALEDPHDAYSYAELDKKVCSLARRLRSEGVDQGKLVGILLPHSADFIIACLATLRAGGTYVIFELAYPPALLGEVINDANPLVLITYHSQAESKSPNVDRQIILDEKEDGWEVPYNDSPLPTEYDQDVMAFVSYSSGTTGRPKGIVNHDRPGVLSYAQRFAISDQGPGDRIACNTFFIWEMFRPLIRGAMAFAVPDEVSYDPMRLVDLLADQHISETLMTPTLLASILSCFPDDAGERLPDLRILWITGEVVSTDLARRALRALPEVRLLNSYSTSETWDTAIGEMKDVLLDAEQLTYCSVGRPLGVNKIYILDEAGNQLNSGETGEVFIGGPVLALKYLNLPDLTAKTFLSDPFTREPGARMYRSGDMGRILPSGALEITGRIGTMIKLRGYSIVPAQVQMAVVEHLDVRDCAVVSHGDGLERQLIAYFVRDRELRASARPCIEVDDIGFSPIARRELLPYLAPYMIPVYWVEVERLPADPVSGKIDRKKLPPPPVAKSEKNVTLPNKDIEDSRSNMSIDTIAEIWASTLKVPRSIITSEHNFFDLGGHSLALAALSNNLTKAFGFRVALTDLAYPATLVSHLAAVLALMDGNTAKSAHGNLLDILRADCLLEEEIYVEGACRRYLCGSDTVLLTGATGFLGAFLLHDLLQDTEATILCLVRGSGSRARIRQHMLEKSLWCDSFAERIEVIGGDLSRKYFGLPFDAFQQVAERVQVIIHAGAMVNLVYPYAALRGTNVIGTREVLRLASLGGCTLHYISTNSVLTANREPKAFQDPKNLATDEVIDGIADGYGQTKWVGEQLVLEAENRGLPVKIHRVGTLSGHSVTGVANPRDLLTALITESIELGCAPKVEGWKAEMSPVDFASKAIICLCDSVATNTIFHLADPNPIDAEELFSCLDIAGIPTKRLGWEAWVALWTEKRAQIESDGLSPIDVLRSGMPTVDSLRDVPILDDAETEPYHKDVVRPDYHFLLGTYTQHWFARGWISRLPPLEWRLEHSSQPVQGRSFKHLVAVVTGASSGIGAATAIALAKEGVHVALAARRSDALESVRNSIQPYGVKVLVQPTDVTDAEQVQDLMETAAHVLGPVDIFVACAGVMYYGLMKNVRKREWEETVDVNCKGLINCLSAIVPEMIERGGGHIVAISSDAGRKVFAGLGVYSGSKFFVEATLQSLRLETIGTGLRVTSIQPGNVKTELLALSTDKEAIEKYGQQSGAEILHADDVAKAIVYALKQPDHVSVNEILIQPRDEPN